MSLFEWTEKSPDILRLGGVIAPDERLPWAQTDGDGHAARDCHVWRDRAGADPDGV